MQYPNWMFNQSITKQRIADFLGLENIKGLAKTDLVSKLKRQFNGNPKELQRYFETFHAELGISPHSVEQTLHCTRAERKRWEEEEKLTVVAYESFSKYGHTYKASLYDRWQVEHITSTTLEKWREEAKTMEIHKSEKWNLKPYEFGGVYSFKVGTKYLSILCRTSWKKNVVICRLPLDFDIRVRLEVIGDQYPDYRDERRFIEIAKLMKEHMHEIDQAKKMSDPFLWDTLERRFLKEGGEIS